MSELGISIAEIAYRGIIPDDELDSMLGKEIIKNSLTTHQNKHKDIDLTSWALNQLTAEALKMNAQELLELQGEVQQLDDTIENRVEKICPDCKGLYRPEGFVDCKTCEGSEFCE